MRISIYTALLALTMMSSALHAAPIAIFDDFEDGDSSDWGFFGGNAAGGGGGVLADRPKEGAFYFSTGWGGEGTGSGFYGGAFKNLPDASQVLLGTDPWFNVWVLNQSNTTADQYNLEISIREDTDGNGWTSGSDDSIGLDTTFSSSSFDDQWRLISAPLSSFFDRGTGGNGVFDGAVDEVVLVFGGVQGGAGSILEVDFDQIAFSFGGPIVVVPIPAAAWLFGSALLGLVGIKRRKA
jgi:hypothetical protein